MLSEEEHNPYSYGEILNDETIKSYEKTSNIINVFNNNFIFTFFLINYPIFFVYVSISVCIRLNTNHIYNVIFVFFSLDVHPQFVIKRDYKQSYRRAGRIHACSSFLSFNSLLENHKINSSNKIYNVM